MDGLNFKTKNNDRDAVSIFIVFMSDIKERFPGQKILILNGYLTDMAVFDRSISKYGHMKKLLTTVYLQVE